MIALSTLRGFTDKQVIDDIKQYFEDEIIKAIKDDKFVIKDTEVSIITDTGSDYKEDEDIDKWLKYKTLTLYALTMRYSSVAKKNVIFNINRLDEDTLYKLLPYADKYNSSILSVKVFKALIYSNYEFLVNNDRMLYGGTQLLHYIMTYKPLSKGLQVCDTKELFLRHCDNTYSFAFDSLKNTVLFDTDMELNMFLRDVLAATKSGDVSNSRNVIVAEETYDLYKKLIQKIPCTGGIVRVIKCDIKEPYRVTRLIEDDFEGLSVCAGVYCRYTGKSYYSSLGNNPVYRVTSYNGLYRFSHLM